MQMTTGIGLLSLILAGCGDVVVNKNTYSPSPTINQPTEGAPFVHGEGVTLSGVVTDQSATHDITAVTVSWLADGGAIDGCSDLALGEDGATSCPWEAVEGTETIGLQAFDPEDAVPGLAQVSITVAENTVPTIEISSPVAGSEYYSNIPVSLKAIVSDVEDDETVLTVLWKNGDDELSVSGGTVSASGDYTGTASFDPGVYSLTAIVTDSAGDPGTDTVTITVFDVNTAPTCTFSSPEPDSGFVSGQSIIFEGTCTDAETAPAQLSVSLSSYTDGTLSENVPIDDFGNFTFPWSDLSPGDHVISVIAEDTPGVSSTANITVTVCDDVWYQDTDGDGHGDPESTVVACEQPSGYVDNSDDCDDDNIDINPGADEICDPDGVDEDCDGDINDGDSSTLSSSKSTWYADTDSDGYGDVDSSKLSCEQPSGYIPDSTDCDDAEPAANPGEAEVCDEIDNDCDGDIDEGVQTTYYADGDSDGYGDPANTTGACSVPTGYVEDSTDCDDGEEDANPGETEVCDEIDNDCDESIDEGVETTYYADSDEDGYGDVDSSTDACEAPSGYVENDEDCDDLDEDISPDAVEVCDGEDNDCNGDIDDDDSGVTDQETFYADDDGDGYGDPADSTDACEQPSGYIDNDDDCDDTSDDISPDAVEVCDEVDNDCDGDIDDDDSGVTDQLTWYEDGDGDGYGQTDSTYLTCASSVSGYALDDGDCNDASATTFPGAAENESLNTCMQDDDGDGYGDDSVPTEVTAGSDCDDSDSTINEEAAEVCDEVDNDCDEAIDDEDSDLDTSTGTTWYADTDSDDYGDADSSVEACEVPSGYVADDTDCDDADAATWPGAASTDSTTDCMRDSDGDGYGDADATGDVTAGDDCDDGDEDVNPAATEYCDTIDNDCDGSTDEDDAADVSTWYADTDSDGYGDASSSDDACYEPSGYVSDDTDCDDGAAAVYPSASEVCDGQYNDCDDASYSASSAPSDELDDDSDGYVECTYSTSTWVGSSSVTGGEDCDDAEADANPGETEVCDEIDNDCDSSIDEGVKTSYYADNDGDSYGDASDSAEACSTPSGYVTDSTDCDDADDVVYPSANEVCDGQYNDCDDSNYSASSAPSDELDDDNDEYVECTYSSSTWVGSGSVSGGEDCDDVEAGANPGEIEVCDSIDNDCDGQIDDDDSSVSGQTTYYADADGDGFGDDSASGAYCEQPTGHVTDNTDCDDSDELTYPGVAAADSETECMTDADGDGFGDEGSSGDVVAGTDCDDAEVDVNPDEEELCGDEIDNDCNGLADFGICGEQSLGDFIRIDGAAYDFLTYPVVGDINDDGYGDIIVAGTGYGSSSTYSLDQGAAFLFYGPVTADTDTSYADWYVYGGSGDAVGYGGSAIADISGDGYPDFMITGYRDGSSDTGEVLLYLGSATERSGSVSTSTTFTSGGYYGRFYGSDTQDFFGGGGARNIGDIDDDGYDDIGVGFPYNDSGGSQRGSAMLFMSDTTTLSGGQWNSVSATDLYGASGDGFFGNIDGAGDVNGDGVDDVLVVGSNPSWSSNPAYVYYLEGGNASLLTGGSVNVGSVYDARYSQHSTLGYGDSFGGARSGGDINGDGYSDLVMTGKYAYNTTGDQVGHAYIILGATTMSGGSIDSEMDLLIYGTVTSTSSTRFGETVMVTPDADKDGIYEDFDGDGDADLIVGQNDTDEGGVFIFFSETITDAIDSGTTSAEADSLADAILRQENTSDGARDIAVGDVTGDGLADLLVGASGYDAGSSTSTGAVYIVSGGFE